MRSARTRSAISTAAAGRPPIGRRSLHSFRDILANVGPNNGLGSDGEVRLSAIAGDQVSARPICDFSSGLYTALKDGGFRYDTSGDSLPEPGPRRPATCGASIWRTSSSADTDRRLLSMDYNFFVAQSHGVVVPSRHEFFKRADARHLSGLFQSQLHRQSRAAPYRSSFLRLSERRLSRGAPGICPDGLRPAGSALCNLFDAGEFHRPPDPETLQAYRNGDFPHAVDPFAVADNWRLRGRIE